MCIPCSAGEKNRKIKSARGRKTAVEGTLLLNLESITELNLLVFIFCALACARAPKRDHISGNATIFAYSICERSQKNITSDRNTGQSINILYSLLGTFRFDNEYKIEFVDNFSNLVCVV